MHCCRRGFTNGAVQLPLLHYVHGLNFGDKFLGAQKRLKAQRRICDAFHSPVVLLHEVIQVLGLTQLNIKTGVSIDAANGSRVGTAFVNGDFL